MPKYNPQLDQLFTALSDPTRRGVLAQLCEGDKTVSELAQAYSMTLPSFTQHMKLLEKSGLVNSTKQGRSRVYTLVPEQFELVEHWLDERRHSWEQRLDQLDKYLLSMKENLQ